jgi:hypothetical protein
MGDDYIKLLILPNPVAAFARTPTAIMHRQPQRLAYGQGCYFEEKRKRKKKKQDKNIQKRKNTTKDSI